MNLLFPPIPWIGTMSFSHIDVTMLSCFGEQDTQSADDHVVAHHVVLGVHVHLFNEQVVVVLAFAAEGVPISCAWYGFPQLAHFVVVV
jgi:hypothetical protein